MTCDGCGDGNDSGPPVKRTFPPRLRLVTADSAPAPPTVTVDLVVREDTEHGVRLFPSDATRQALLDLGWTPPRPDAA